MRLSSSIPVGIYDYEHAPVAASVALCSARLEDVAAATTYVEKRVWTMSTLFPSDWFVQPPDRPGFRRFPRDPSNGKAKNRVRVPPRARHNPLVRGVFAFKCVQTLTSASYLE